MDIKSVVLKSLNEIEARHHFRILYACESGSRAWGFASTDSDFDVRFIYLNPPDWYLSINLDRKRDVIELPIDEGLDISGWDLRKALQLFQKSNPPLLEWLGSPIIYLERYLVIEKMRELADECYSPIACQYHYYKMAKGNHRDYMREEEVWLKKYLYVLRPVLAVMWLEREMGVVPTEFQKLVDGVVEQQNLKDAIAELLRLKQAGAELDKGPRLPAISEFLDQELARMEAQEFAKRVGDCPVARLNEIFRAGLKEVWSSESSIAT